MTEGWQRACVIGSGMAGLMAARVLADHFDEVVVFERDQRPTGDGCRAGVVQGDHIHALTRRGQVVIEALFPGLIEDLVSQGAKSVADIGTGVRAYLFGAWAVPCHVGFGALQFTQPLLEYGVRRRVEEMSNVFIRYDAGVAGLICNGGQARVTGVRLRAGGDGQAEAVRADLVVDASGRGAAGLSSLRSYASSVPREDIVSLSFTCATALFKIPRGFYADWSSLWIAADSPDTKLAVIHVVEGGRWLVSVGGRGADQPEATETGLREFARRCPSAMLDDLISQSQILSPVKRYRFAASLHRRYDLLDAHPESFLALGDAICSINPLYGQGISIAAMEVEALAACLTARTGGALEGLWREFYRRTLKVIEVPWGQALELDLLHNTTKFERPKGSALRRTALLWAQRLSTRDPALRAAMLRSAHLVPEAGDEILLSDLARAQARIWLAGKRITAAPAYSLSA